MQKYTDENLCMQAHAPCTSEEAFIINPALAPESMREVIDSMLLRTLSLVTLLVNDDSSDNSHHTVGNVLWLVQGQLEQVAQAFQYYSRQPKLN